VGRWQSTTCQRVHAFHSQWTNSCWGASGQAALPLGPRTDDACARPRATLVTADAAQPTRPNMAGMCCSRQEKCRGIHAGAGFIVPRRAPPAQERRTAYFWPAPPVGCNLSRTPPSTTHIVARFNGSSMSTSCGYYLCAIPAARGRSAPPFPFAVFAPSRRPPRQRRPDTAPVPSAAALCGGSGARALCAEAATSSSQAGSSARRCACDHRVRRPSAHWLRQLGRLQRWRSCPTYHGAGKN
jgi:hypothetical protein